jgi:hypothetical protein
MLVKPWFESLENDIDRTIDSIGERIWRRLKRFARVAIFELFFSSQDGVLLSAMPLVTSMLSQSAALNSTIVPEASFPFPAQNKKSVDSFVSLMSDGLVVGIRTNESNYIPCIIRSGGCTVAGIDLYRIIISPFRGIIDEPHTTEAWKTIFSLSETSETEPMQFSFALWTVCTVLMPDATLPELLEINLNISFLTSHSSVQPLQLHFTAADANAAEALALGLQATILKAKRRMASVLAKSFHHLDGLTETTLLASAFEKMKLCNRPLIK